MRLGLAAVWIAVSSTLAGHFGLRVLALIGITLGTSGCVTWRPYDLRPEFTAGQSLPHRLRATRADSSRISLTAPFVRADTLYGRMRADTVGLRITDIAYLERERLSLERTAAMVVGVPAVALASRT